MIESEYIAPKPENAVLLTIDMQQDFSVPDAPAYIEGTETVLPPLQRVLDAFRARQRPIVHVVRLYRTDGSNVDACRRRNIEQGGCVVAPDTEGAKLVEKLKPASEAKLKADALLDGSLQPLAEQEWAMYKPRWGAFFQTPLENFLQERNINTIVVAGCNFPNCPRTTIYEASERDFRIVMVSDAVSGTYDRGLRELESIGVCLMNAQQCQEWVSQKNVAASL